MPMLYGEGNKAFKRLQEEIMKESDDTTLLSWCFKFPGYEYFEADRILAPNPGSFKNCHNLVPSELPGFSRPSFSMTQRGLVFTMPVRQDQNHEHLIYAILACGDSQSMLTPGHCENLLVIPLVSASACDSPALWKDQDEYLRYSWCPPTLVSTEFIKGASTRSVVIRRPSRLTKQLRYLPGILRPLRGGKLIGMYPPQPLDMFSGTRFVSLGASSFSQPDTKPHQSNRSKTGPASPEDGNGIQGSEKTSIGLYLINISGDRLLVVLEFEMKTDHAESVDVISCRAFEMPLGVFGLELLHNLAFTRDYAGLREIPAMSREEDILFRIKEEEDNFLFVRTRKYARLNMRSMAEIEIFLRME
jgi:hypothetical protein